MNIVNALSILRNVRIKSLEKGEILIPAGSSCTDLFFVRKGLMRSYRGERNAGEEEVTFQLFPENHISGNIHTIFLKQPSSFFYEAIEPTKLYIIDYKTFSNISNTPKLGEFSRKFLGKRLVKQAFQRVESFVFLTPEERYLKYTKDNPNIINRAPDKYIAHILGITPTSLSRIRKRITSKKR